MASLYNLMHAGRVETFLSDLEAANFGENFHERDKLLQCIHMLIWLHSSRPGSTAGAYAFVGLMEAIGLAHWEFKKDPDAGKAAAPPEPPVQLSVPVEFKNLFPAPDAPAADAIGATDDIAEPEPLGMGGPFSDSVEAFPEGDGANDPSGLPEDPDMLGYLPGDFDLIELLRGPMTASEVVVRAVHQAVDSVFLSRLSDLIVHRRQPTVDGKPTSYSDWIAHELAPALERSLRRNDVIHPTDEMVEAATDAIMSEWKVMADEAGADKLQWPISPTNRRLLEAGIRAAMGEAPGAVTDEARLRDLWVDNENLRFALEPFARVSETYPDADPSAAPLTVHDARCPVTMRDCHNAKRAMDGETLTHASRG